MSLNESSQFDKTLSKSQSPSSRNFDLDWAKLGISADTAFVVIFMDDGAVILKSLRSGQATLKANER